MRFAEEAARSVRVCSALAGPGARLPNATAARGVYTPPRPQTSPLFRLVSDHLHRLQTVYDDRFAREYGPWRTVVAQVADKGLESEVRPRILRTLGAHRATQFVVVAMSGASVALPSRLKSVCTIGGTLRMQGLTAAAIGRQLKRHRRTITREFERNSKPFTGYYQPCSAHPYAVTRWSHSRRSTQCTVTDWERMDALLRTDWSPEQIAGRYARDRGLSISHETIYRHIWRDKTQGGSRHVHLRRANKPFRKRYAHDDRQSRLTRIGKLARRTSVKFNARPRQLLRAERRSVHTITADTGTKFHGDKQLEATLPPRFSFATPHHSWERGSNQNTNGFIRQSLPKRVRLEHVTQRDCIRIATRLNQRPRKYQGVRSPEECYEP